MALFVVLATATLILTGCQMMPPKSQTVPRSTGPSLGELEHRGHRYALRDLNSQAYREASNDPFVHDFNPETVLAREDASRGLRTVPMSASVLDFRR